ncbi:MAG: LAGLIDADG family homing endonuclease [Candidatus Aenigmatarchaeota archaeon]
MRVIADLHLHGPYSRATSRGTTIANLEKYALMKGVGLLGTGDFTHPQWLKTLKSELTEDGSGILRTKTGFPFMLSAEICNIYEQEGRVRKIHNVLHAPDFATVDQVNEFLGKKGNLRFDGRPTFSGMGCPELAEGLMQISKDIMVIPSHVWTPWFGIFGSKSGFDSVGECFGDQARHIFALETGMSCYDGEAEVLTENGWKKFNQVHYDDKICTLNLEHDNIEFQTPLRIQQYKYNGKMYKLKTKRVDLLVTPNHKLLFSPCDFRNPKPFCLKEAEFLFGKSKRLKKDGIWIGDNVEHFILPAVKIRHGSRYYSGFRGKPEKRLPIRPWLRFFGFWMAEGWVTGSNGDYGIYICNRKKALLDEMTGILETFGYDVYRQKDVIRVRDFQLFEYLKQFGKASGKYIPPCIKSLSKELIEIFFDYYIKGDGHVYGRTGKGLSATTISKRLRDDLQEVALKMGMSAYYKLKMKKGTPFKSPANKGRTYYQSEDSWDIFFIRNNRPIILPSAIKKHKYVESWEDYEGFVFCVSVPNHVIYIRRNGIPLWCGNSDPAMNWRLSALDKYALVSNSDAHSYWPWRVGREANVFELPELSYAGITGAVREKDAGKFIGTIEVDPGYGKYHLDGHRECGVRLTPSESAKSGKMCPSCRRPLTIGVLHRVEELADRPEGYTPRGAIPFKTMLPLAELIAASKGVENPNARSVWEVYMRLMKKFGSEFSVLMDAPPEGIKEASDARIAGMVTLMREGRIKVEPGYDGVYGKLSAARGALEKPSDERGPQRRLTGFFS